MLNSLLQKIKHSEVPIVSGKKIRWVLLPIASPISLRSSGFRLLLFFLLYSNWLSPVALFSQTWNKVGTGVHPSGGEGGMGIYKNELYYGGLYSISSPPYYNIIKWDGSVWTPVDSASGWPYIFLEYNNELYVGGRFASIQGAGSQIAKWDGSQWLSLGGGVTSGSSINDLKVFNGDVYSAGNFNNIGGIFTRGIAKWNGTNWSAVGGGLSGGFPTTEGQALIFKNELYVGGDFTMAGSIPANYIARWNGTKWDSVGGGTTGEILGFVIDTMNDFLYAGGRFGFNKGAVRWDGYSWTSLDSGINADIYNLAIYHNQLYAVGALFAVGGEGVARWNGTYWEAVGGGTTPGGTTVYSCQVYKDELYVGGGFTDAGGDTSIKYIARWYSPPDTTCKFLQPIIESMQSLTVPNGVADTFYYNTGSVAVQFYNNIASASSWQWDFGDSTTGSGKTPIHYYTAGIYTVSVIVIYPYGSKGPCVDTVYKTITVINTTGTSHLTSHISHLRFKVYPNPTTGEITIATEQKGTFTASITNAQGKELSRKNFEKEIKFSLPANAKGIYFVKVCDEKKGGGHTEKVVME